MDKIEINRVRGAFADNGECNLALHLAGLKLVSPNYSTASTARRGAKRLRTRLNDSAVIVDNTLRKK